jgi:hypothetical protein
MYTTWHVGELQITLSRAQPGPGQRPRRQRGPAPLDRITSPCHDRQGRHFLSEFRDSGDRIPHRPRRRRQRRRRRRQQQRRRRRRGGCHRWWFDGPPDRATTTPSPKARGRRGRGPRRTDRQNQRGGRDGGAGPAPHSRPSRGFTAGNPDRGNPGTSGSAKRKHDRRRASGAAAAGRGLRGACGACRVWLLRRFPGSSASRFVSTTLLCAAVPRVRFPVIRSADSPPETPEPIPGGHESRRGYARSPQ